MSVYVTGDCHGDFRRFNTTNFKEQKDLTRDDIVIILGDTGILWDRDESGKEEKYWLDWLNNKNFTILFVDGNHENFDRLNALPVVDLFGGKAHKLRDNIYHLMRGNVFEIEGKKFFAFGGASSHDIDGGILDPNDYEDKNEFLEACRSLRKRHKSFRVRHVSWWDEELPTEAEMEFAENTLEKHDYKVDYVISHCCPQEVASVISRGFYKPDVLTTWFNKLIIEHELKFDHWYFGHYHSDMDLWRRFHLRYLDIERII